MRCTERVEALTVLAGDAGEHLAPQTLSLSTKNKTLNRNPDGSLILYASAESPGADNESNWLPTPDGTFSLCILAY